MVSEEITLPALVEQSFSTFRRSGASFYRRGDGFAAISSEHFLETIRRLALGLRALGLKRGEVVAIIAPSSPWWLMVDLAIMVAGGCSTAVFPKISKKNLLYQLKDSGSRFVYIDTQELWDFAKTPCSHLKVILRDVEHSPKKGVMTFNSLLQKGDQLSLEQPSLYRHLCKSLQADDIATLIYTSGSTGYPKGVMLSHRNLCSQIVAAIQRYPLNPAKDSALSALPLAHCFERTVVYTYFCQGIPVYFADDIQKLKEYLPEVQPTVMTMVPRMLEKIFAKLQERIALAIPPLRILGEWSCRVGLATNPHPFSRAIADLLLFRKIRAAMGGKLNTVIVGGAPLDALICQFFITAGVDIYQGYGLTETSPVLTANYPGHNRPGTVGPVFPGVQVEIRGPESEIRCKGPNIMKGYHKLAELSARRFDSEGWFCTGDCGKFDGQGNLMVTGRLTEMFKTSTGKFVSPIPIEQALIKLSLIDAAMVIADGKSFVTALLFADAEVLQRTLGDYQHSPTCSSPQDANYCIMILLQKQIDLLNETVNEWEQIRNFRFITEELTIESGLLTPAMKLCRGKVTEQYAALIDSMYGAQTDAAENLLKERV